MIELSLRLVKKIWKIGERLLANAIWLKISGESDDAWASYYLLVEEGVLERQ